VQGGGESHVFLPTPSGLVSPCTLGGRDRNLPIMRTPPVGEFASAFFALNPLCVSLCTGAEHPILRVLAPLAEPRFPASSLLLWASSSVSALLFAEPFQVSSQF
jgi:hypothetical protein